MTSSSQKFQDHGGLHPSRGKLHVTVLASEWRSTKGGLSTISRELAIELAKFPEVKITYFVPKCNDEDKRTALSHHIEIVEATRLSGYDELEWLSFPPDDLQIDVIVGHGVKLGHQAQVIRKTHKCKWIQVVHTDPEELGMYKSYENPISTGEKKHKVEVELCEKADFVVGVGPKLCEAFRRYLRWCKKDKTIIDLTPGVFDEFANVEHASDERERCSILVFGRGDVEDFQLKGFDVAGKAVAELSDAHLVFVGAPEGKHEDIAKRLRECGVPAHRLTVRSFLQSRVDLKRLFCEVDLVLMPSRTEGFGLTGLKALSAGLPVLVSKNSGFGEALCKVPFGSACVIDSEDSLVWAEAIKEVWKRDRETRLQEAEQLRSSYKKKYSWAKQSEHLVKKMVNIVNQDCQISSQGEEGLSLSSASQATQTMAGRQTAMYIIHDLQRMQCDPSKFQKKTGLSEDLQTIASDKGFSICDNPGSGNCMFYALSEQLQSVKGIQISETELWKKLVECLRNFPKLTDGTDLFNFVHEYSSWADYLRSMEKDGTWGDHLILRAAANCYKTPIRVISSLDRDITVNPDHFVGNTSSLVLGHIHEKHYVSLQPTQGGPSAGKTHRTISFNSNDDIKVVESNQTDPTTFIERQRQTWVSFSEEDGQEENSQTQLSDMKQRVKRMQEKLRENEDELEISQSLREQQLTNFHEQQRHLHEQLRDKDQQEENLQRQLREIREQLREKHQQEKNLQRQLREIQEQLREKHEQEENLQRQLRGIQEQLREKDTQEENLQRQLRGTQKQLRGKHQQEKNLQRQLRKIQEQLREKDQQEENLQRQLREIQKQLRGKHQQEKNLQRQLREIREQLREKHQQEKNLQRQLREIQEQLREKDQQEENLQRQLREIREQLREKHQQEKNLQRQLREIQEQLREKDQQEENLQRQLKEIQEQLREKHQQEENLQRQLRKIQEQLRGKDQQEENLKRQLREIQEQLRGKDQQEKSAQRQVTALERQLRIKDQHVNELRIALSTAQQALSEHQRRQVTPDWVISRYQIQLTDKLLGRGGWGSVVEGKYCGCSVAVKQIHELILSPHNRTLFEREMDVASRCHHPCLLLFVGATNDEGSPLFVTELMESSLRALLEQRPLAGTEVSIISLDVARALNYLHQKKPSPIIHRDISSANVLLWRQGGRWRGKVSDYGAANFMQHTMTACPGAAIYIAPEALTSNQTVKVDVYSFGVLLCEMCIRELPDPERRDQQIAMVKEHLLRALIRGCLQSDPEARPNMEEIIEELEEPV